MQTWMENREDDGILLCSILLKLIITLIYLSRRRIGVEWSEFPLCSSLNFDPIAVLEYRENFPPLSTLPMEYPGKYVSGKA